jgi:hypothetical protein
MMRVPSRARLQRLWPRCAKGIGIAERCIKSTNWACRVVSVRMMGKLDSPGGSTMRSKPLGARGYIRLAPALASCRFEQLDWIAVRVFYLNLFATRPDFQLIAKVHAAIPELGNAGR